MSTSHEVTVNGTTLRCQVDGPEGAPWLLFSNSLMTDLSLWGAQVATFGDRYRILRYDQRGHGGSLVPQQDCTFDQLVEDARALLDHFAIARAAAIGVSMGGVTMLGLAGKYPDRISHAAICDCQPVSTPAGAASWEERIVIARAGGMQALVEPTIGRWFRPETLASAAPDPVRRMIAATKLEGFIRAARALQNYDFRGYLTALSCPTRFIVGAQDAALPTAMRSMANLVPGADLITIDACGHLPNIERPAAFNTAVTDLLTQNRS